MSRTVWPLLFPKGTLVEVGNWNERGVYQGNAGKRWNGQDHFVLSGERRYRIPGWRISAAGRWEHVEGLLYRFVPVGVVESGA